jgi:hypothetical protein
VVSPLGLLIDNGVRRHAGTAGPRGPNLPIFPVAFKAPARQGRKDEWNRAGLSRHRVALRSQRLGSRSSARVAEARCSRPPPRPQDHAPRTGHDRNRPFPARRRAGQAGPVRPSARPAATDELALATAVRPRDRASDSGLQGRYDWGPVVTDSAARRFACTRRNACSKYIVYPAQ